MGQPHGVVPKLLRVFDHACERTALVVGRNRWTYGQLRPHVFGLAGRLQDVAVSQPLVGFLCDRDQNAYVAVLSILLSGRGYVPLNPRLPVDRLRRIVAASKIGTVVVGPGRGELADLVAPDLQHVRFEVASAPGLATCEDAEFTPPAVTESDAAYLLFTSGSTGAPKGVLVSHGNLAAYVSTVVDLYRYGPDDVHSQTFELTFDLSVHDMMCAWTTGGCLVRLAGAELMAPVGMVQRHAVTSWFSVPSTGSLMAARGGLKANSMPSLRTSLFCGEALPAALASAWSSAAPNSLVENLYGPTEATIAITRYRWLPGRSEAASRLGLVPIGRAFDNQKTLLVGEQDTIIEGAGRGELLLSGSQVTGAYWDDPTNTNARYATIQGMSWYRTGDIVDVDEDGCMHFVGRSDSQVKFRGYRIELREIEETLASITGTDLVVVVPWPISDHEIQGLVAVVAGAGHGDALAALLRQRLPDYMVPQLIRFVDRLPTNLSGKIDRKAILAWLDDEGQSGSDTIPA